MARADYKILYHNPPSSKTSSASATNDIWQAFRTEFTLDHEAYRTEVKEQIAWFMAHRKFLYAAAKNARPYLYYIVSQIEKRHLPAEFALIPIIESAYDPFAYSAAGAAGLWQMMPATATDFGLKQNWWYDGRRDVLASTNAALDYLVYLQNFFSGNWLFVLAAYHSGQGTVLSAIKKNATEGGSTSFWSLTLGKQAQAYIPKILTLAVMIRHPEKYPLNMPAIPNRPYLTQVDVGSQIDLAKAAKLSGLSLSELLNLNPGFNRWATSPDGPYVLTVPIQNETTLREGLSLLPQGNRVTWVRYDVKSGDTLGKIATKYHTTMALLQQVNKLDDTMIHVGDVLFIPNSSKYALPKKVPTESRFVPTTEPTGAVLQEANQAVKSVEKLVASQTASAKNLAKKTTTQVIYHVKKGDSLESIAKQFHVRWESIKTFNHLSSNALKIGQKLSILPGAKNVTLSVKKSPKKITYVIKVGDSLSKIAQKYSVSVKNLKRWNPQLAKSPVLRLGQSLLIYS